MIIEQKFYLLITDLYYIRLRDDLMVYEFNFKEDLFKLELNEKINDDRYILSHITQDSNIQDFIDIWLGSIINLTQSFRELLQKSMEQNNDFKKMLEKQEDRYKLYNYFIDSFREEYNEKNNI